MTNPSCMVSGKHLGYFFSVMAGLMIMLYLMFQIAIDPTKERVYRALTLIVLLSFIALSLALFNRSTFKVQKVRDHTLK